MVHVISSMDLDLLMHSLLLKYALKGMFISLGGDLRCGLKADNGDEESMVWNEDRLLNVGEGCVSHPVESHG